MIALDDFQEWRRVVEQLNRKADEASGMKKRILSEVKAKFGVGSLSEIEELLEREADAEQEWYRKYAKKFRTFKKEFGPVLARHGIRIRGEAGEGGEEVLKRGKA